MKRIIFLFTIMLLAIFMTLSVMASTQDVGKLRYTIENNEVTITGLISGTNIIIPEEIEGYPVTKIKDYAFSKCDKILNVELPNTLKIIGNYAFEYCGFLETINIPYGVEVIGDYAFRSCYSVKEFIIPESVHTLGTGIFVYTNIEKITIPDNIKVIPDELFLNCFKLKEINMAEDVVQIGNASFAFCEALINPCIGDNVKKIGKGAFQNCQGFVSVAFPESVEVIEDYAFANCCNLKFAMFPASVKVIGDNIFGGCSEFESIYYALSKKDFENIEYNNVKTYVFPENFHYDCGEDPFACGTMLLENGQFEYICYGGVGTILCGKGVDITIPEEIYGNTVVAINSKAFADCKELVSVSIPDTVADIGHSAFYGCSNLVSANLPTSLSEIKYNMFYNCMKLESINIPEGIIKIGDSAFYSCRALSSFEIPDSVTIIGNYTFYRNGSKSIVIPDSVKSIGKQCFTDSNKLEMVKISKNILELPDSIFFECDNLKTVVFGDNSNLETVGAGAFGECKSLVDITLPDSVENIGISAFSYCVSLPLFKAPSNLTNIGMDAFHQCKSLKLVVLNEGLTEIGSDVFASANIKELWLPSSILRVKIFAFSNCEFLETVYYMGSEEEFASIILDEYILDQYCGPAFGSAEIIYNCNYSDWQGIKGDVDNDKILTSSDALVLKKYFVGLISIEDMCADNADINEDGAINAKDHLELHKLLVA